MGILESMRGQFLDVIEYIDNDSKLIICKVTRGYGDNELKQGSKVIVREGQYAAFVRGGEIADILPPGTYSLNTKNFPILTKLNAFPYLFVSPVISDVYFINSRKFVDNKWATKNPVMKRDRDFTMVRIRAFGKFTFRISDAKRFMREVFGARRIMTSYDIENYLSSMVTEAFSTEVAESNLSVLDIASHYRLMADNIKQKVNLKAHSMGISFTEIIIENISLPDDVEKLIDEQSGISLARTDMNTFIQYHATRAMRDIAKQPESGGTQCIGVGLGAGVGTGLGIGNLMAYGLNSLQSQNQDNISYKPDKSKTKFEQLKELKSLLDEGILTKEEFEAEKLSILKKE